MEADYGLMASLWKLRKVNLSRRDLGVGTLYSTGLVLAGLSAYHNKHERGSDSHKGNSLANILMISGIGAIYLGIGCAIQEHWREFFGYKKAGHGS